MATSVFITVDTELSLAQHQAGVSAQDNLRSSIFGRFPEESNARGFGILHQMDRLDQYGLKAVFFVDPMPSLAYGKEAIKQIVTPILERGHDVQLHIHTEWLEFIESQPVGPLRGRNIGDFPLDAQTTLLTLAKDLLTKAGAPEPVAFRAGNYGANDDTLRALSAIGMRYDSSYNPCYSGDGCDIGLNSETIEPVSHMGLTELPVSTIYDRKNHLRHAQICALSAWEMKAALHHAAATKASAFTIVTHSFELLSRDRQRPNYSVIRRFDQMCKTIAVHPDLKSATYQDNPAFSSLGAGSTRLPANPARTLARMSEQALAQIRYERE